MGEPVITAENTGHIGHTWQSFIDSRRYAWLILFCALAAASLWYVSAGRLGGWPLLIALPPWGLRLAAGRFPVKQTRFDPLLWLFLISAAVSAWVSYNQPAAWDKFWLIVGATILFYALAGQRAPNLWTIFMGLAVFGGAIAVYFLATHDWNAIPAKIEMLNRIGLRWMEWRPAVFDGLHSLHPNVAGGLIAMLFPFSLAGVMRAARKGQGRMLAVAGLSGFFMAVGLIFSTSRGAWLALAGGLVIWAIWSGSGRVAEVFYLSRRKAFGVEMLLFMGVGVTLMLLTSGGLLATLDRLPGPASAGSRLEISQDALDLAGDFWITGGGLGAFDGLYSQYIRVIPYHYLIHSHNLFLNVAVEQGVIGLTALVAMLGLAAWWLIAPRQSGYRRTVPGFRTANGAVLATLVVTGMHGLVDDPLYGSRAVLLLWLPLGLTAFLFPLRVNWIQMVRTMSRPALVAGGVVILLAAALLVVFGKPIAAAWQSNLGALEMARIELRGYPTGTWSDGREAVELASAGARFERALALNPNNRTALHRLGLIAMLERDYGSASDYLYSAYLLDRGHRGIRKSLMYSTIWSGHISQALPLMAGFPETQAELGVYQWWWNQMGYPEFSRAAEEARIQLEASPAKP